MSGKEFQLVKMETRLLKVHIHCEGCARKVKKVLKKIEGVYQVSIDAEQQKVLVYGNVDSATLIRKLIKSGKHAELWTSSHGQSNPQGLTKWLMDDKNQNMVQSLTNGLSASNATPMIPRLTDRGFDDWNSEMYPNQSAGIEPFMGRNNVHLSWDGDTIADAHSREGNIKSLVGFQDFANNAGSYSGIEDGGFAGIQNLHGSLPAFEHYYSPFSMTNNMQQYQYSIPPPSPVMMNTEIPDLRTVHSMPVYDRTYPHQNRGIVNPLLNMVPTVAYRSWN